MACGFGISVNDNRLMEVDMNRVYGVWVYEPGKKDAVLWSLHSTENRAKDSLKFIQEKFEKTGFTGMLPVN